MAQEELGYNSGLPKSVVKHAKKVFSEKNNVNPPTMEKVKTNLFKPQAIS